MPNQPFPDQLNEWQAESLRLTAFPTPGYPTTPRSWWIDILGEPPEKKSERPKEGVLTEEGPFEGGRLLLGIAPFRIDWIFTASDPTQTIGPFSQALDAFLLPTRKWLQQAPSLLRMAFGPVFVNPVNSREEGYRRISQVLPAIAIDPEGSSDFLYQINRRRTSTVLPDLRINRVSKWSVRALALSQLRLSQLGQPLSLTSDPVLFRCRLELDVNTPQENENPLPKDKLGEVYQELVDLALEIAEKGDIK
jgi:hypothetical protein